MLGDIPMDRAEDIRSETCLRKDDLSVNDKIDTCFSSMVSATDHEVNKAMVDLKGVTD